MFEDHGAVVGRDFDEMLDLATGFVACGDKLPAGKRVAIVTSSGGGGVWMADACVRAGLDVPELDRATRAAIDAHLPSYGTSQNPIDTTAQGVHQLGYAAFAQLAAQSPLVDGVILIVTARHANFLIKDQPQLTALGRETEKPVLVWSYTLPAEQSVAILTEAGYPLFTNAETCARTLRALADYRATREALLRTPPAKAAE
jgi:acyl-CoA synthetase (NDP forming)